MKYLKILAVVLLFLMVGFSIYQNYTKDNTQVKEFTREYFQTLAEESGAIRVRAFVGLEGTGTGYLGKIDGADLNDLDVAFVVTDDGAYFYTLDATSGLPQDSPNIILPSGTAGDKRWVLTTLYGKAVSTSAQDNAAVDYEPLTAVETRYRTGPNHSPSPDGVDNDNYEIRRHVTPGTDVDYRVRRDYVEDVSGNNNDDRVTQDYEEGQLIATDFDEAVSLGDGAFYFNIGQKLGGLNLVYCNAAVITASDSGTNTNIQLYRIRETQRDGSENNSSNMLSTVISIDDTEYTSGLAGDYVINSSFDDVEEKDIIRVDVDSAGGTSTPPEGLLITLGFSLGVD